MKRCPAFYLLIHLTQLVKIDCVLFFTFRFGLFAFGYYGIGFELSVEATYPIDEGKFEHKLNRTIAIFLIWILCDFNIV